jgi:YVTN family beta-propeller protein
LPPAVAVKLTAAIRIANPDALTAFAGAIWVTSPAGVERIDPKTAKVMATIKLGSGDHAGISGDGSALWVSEYDSDTLYRIDTATNKVVTKITVGLNPEGVVATPDGVWVANHHDGSVSRIDPAADKVIATVHVTKAGNSGPQPIASGFGSIWVGSGNNTSVARIDPASDKVAAYVYDPSPAEPCGGFAIGADVIWSSSCLDTPVIARIDPATNKVVATVDVGGDPGNGGAGEPILIAGAPWFPVEPYVDRSTGADQPGALVRIDPASDRVDRVLKIGGTFLPSGMVETSDSVWLVDTQTDGGLVDRLPISALH